MALARAWKRMSWFYYQYLLVTALYMLEPWERTVFSILRPAGRGPSEDRGRSAGQEAARRGLARARPGSSPCRRRRRPGALGGGRDRVRIARGVDALTFSCPRLTWLGSKREPGAARQLCSEVVDLWALTSQYGFWKTV